MLKYAAAALAALTAIGAPLAAGLGFLLDPLVRRRSTMKGADEGYLYVTHISQLPGDGTPSRFVLRADRVDSWNVFKDRTVGAVYLRKIDDKNVLALNDICPHLGCKIEYKSVDKQYLCPCHGGLFKSDGERINLVAPRPMDTLQVKLKDDGSVWVQYQEFEGGKAQKVVLG